MERSLHKIDKKYKGEKILSLQVLLQLCYELDVIIDLDLSQQNSGKAIQNAVVKVGKSIWDKQKARGMKPQPIKTMIIGIPNVGKSSLINRFAKRSAAGVENKPGFTRGQQWIKVSNEFVLLDTPGILPMNYENKKKAMNLALLGSIREDILPTEDMARALVDFLRSHYPSSLKARFDIETIGEFDDVINGVCGRLLCCLKYEDECYKECSKKLVL